MSSKHLRANPELKNVYLAPDRSVEERLAQRRTVDLLKKIIKLETNVYHSIREKATWRADLVLMLTTELRRVWINPGCKHVSMNC